MQALLKCCVRAQYQMQISNLQTQFRIIAFIDDRHDAAPEQLQASSKGQIIIHNRGSLVSVTCRVA